MPESSTGKPWWNAGDDEFEGATPLFGDRRPNAEGAEEAAAPASDGEPAGSPVMEALRLAAAVAEWSRESGLTETLKGLAAEAAEALVTGEAAANDGEDVEIDVDVADGARVLHLHAERHESGEGPEVIVACDFCPLCRGLEVVRQVQPQVSQVLAEAMAGLTAALNTAVAGFAAKQRPYN